IALRYRRRLTLFDLATLAVTLAGAIQAIRGIVWFAMACQVVLPVALGGLLESRPNAAARRINVGIATASALILVAAGTFDFARDRSWYLQQWPEKAVAAARSSAADGSRMLAA